MRYARRKSGPVGRLRSLRMEPLEDRNLLAVGDPVGTVVHDSSGNLFSVDIRDNWAVEYLGTTNQIFFDMAFSPGGELYGIGTSGDLSWPSELYRVNVDLADPTGGVIDTEFIGMVQLSNDDPLYLNALKFRSDGVLLGAGYDWWGDNFVYSIDVDTATATAEISTGIHGSAGDIAFTEDGSMYLTTSDIVDPTLLRIDPGLTTVEEVGLIDYSDFFGLIYGPEPTLHGFREGWEVYRINPDDGALARVTLLDNAQLGYIYGAATLYQPPTDLGPVDFVMLPGETPIVGELWYRVEPVREAIFTVDLPGVDPTADIDVTLHRRKSDGSLLQLETGKRRFDYEKVSLGDVYYLQVKGAGSDVDVRITNLVQTVGVGNGAVIHGSNQADIFEFSRGAYYDFSINGVDYQFGFNPTSPVNITFAGGMGGDTARLNGSAGNETVVMDLATHSAELASWGYQVHVTDTSRIEFDGGGDDDSVMLLGTASDDLVTIDPARIELSQSPMPLPPAVAAINVASVIVDAGDGDDGVSIPGSDDVDVTEQVLAWPNRVEYRNPTSDHLVVQCETLNANAGGGSSLDTVFLYDSPGDDHFYADSNSASMTVPASPTAPGFHVEVTDFPYVHGYAGPGNDTAEIYDSPDDDTLLAHHGQVKLAGRFTPQSSGEEVFYSRRMKGFEEVTVSALDTEDVDSYDLNNPTRDASGGMDTAYLHDSPHDDQFTSSFSEAMMEVNVRTPPSGRQVDATVTAALFDYVHARATHGNDAAELNDSHLDDRLTTKPAYAKLVGRSTAPSEPGFYVRAKHFDVIDIHAIAGGRDIASMHDSPGNDTFTGALNLASMAADDGSYRVRAYSFEKVHAHSWAGDDTASLYDTALTDYLSAGLPKLDPGHWAKLELQSDVFPGELFLHVQGFGSVDAYATDSEDTSNLDPATADWLVTHGWS